MRKAQVFLFVLFFLLIVGILVGSLAFLWQSGMQIRSLQKEGLIAFYLAQAGIERAKIEIVNNVNLAAGPASYNSGVIYELDSDYPDFIADPINNHLYDDGFVFRYSYTINDIAGPPTTDRQIIGIGEVCEFIDNGPDGIEGTADDNVNIHAHREIQVTIDGIEDTDADGRDDDPSNNSVVAWSWREI